MQLKTFSRKSYEFNMSIFKQKNAGSNAGSC